MTTITVEDLLLLLLILNVSIAMMIFLYNFIGSDVLINCTGDDWSVLYHVLRSRVLSLSSPLHGLLHGLKLVNVRLWLIHFHIAGAGIGLSSAMSIVSQDGAHTMRGVGPDYAPLTIVKFNLATLGAHSHILR